MHIEDQPAPTTNGRTAIWDQVIADMQARDKLGRERYGTPLQAFNGRDALVDAYQEALDLSVYLRQAIAEREEAQANHVQHCLWARNGHAACPHMQPAAVPPGWAMEAVEDGIRLTAPDGERWRFRETDGSDLFVFKFLRAMLNAAPAYASGAASESNRADALAATIAELRDLVTTEGETKAGFVARVRAVLGEDPDARVVRVAAAAYEKGQEDMLVRMAEQQAAEPVAWLFQNEETGLTECVDAQQVEWGFEKNNPRWQKIAPLYTHPAPAQQPLTDEQINDIARRIGAINTGVSLGASVMRLIRAIEAAHGITGSKEGGAA